MYDEAETRRTDLEGSGRWSPDTDPRAMMEVVEKMEADDFWMSSTRKTTRASGADPTEGPRMWHVTFRCVYGGTRGDHTAAAPTLMEAACRAAIRAKEAQ